MPQRDIIIDLARAKRVAPVYAIYFCFKQWSLNHCKEIHKTVLKGRTMHITEKHILEPAIN